MLEPDRLVTLRGCLPEDAHNPDVRSVLGALAEARVPCADLAADHAQQVGGSRVTVGAVAKPSGHSSGAFVQWYEAGSTDEGGLPARRVRAVRGMRNRVLDECTALLRGLGFAVTTLESSRTRTRRVQSLFVSGEPDDLAQSVAHTLAQADLVRVGVLPPYWPTPDHYRLTPVAAACLLTFSHATPVERVRDAVAALRAQGLDANEDTPNQYGIGYGVLVSAGGLSTRERDGLRPETPQFRAARDLLWTRGFSREKTESGTIGHRVYPQLPAHLRDGAFNVDNTSPNVLAALHDRVSVTAPDIAYAEGRGQELAGALSAAHAAAFEGDGWTVVREDPITSTALRPPCGHYAEHSTGGRRTAILTQPC
ncbi:hypothetical protein ACW14Y_40810 [Kitasatospora sp. cg17-2]